VSFDGELGRYVVVSPEWCAAVRRARDGQELLRLPLPQRPELPGRPHFVPQFSPDGRYLAVCSRCSPFGTWQATVWELSERPTPPRLLLPASAFVFLPQGRGAALLADGALGLYDLASGRELNRVAVGAVGAGDTAPGRLCAAGAHVLVANRADRMVRQVDPQAGTVRDLGALPEAAAKGLLACRADGRLAALSDAGGRILLYALPEWALRGVLARGPAAVDRLAFSGPGDLLAVHSADGLTTLWRPDSGERLVSARGRFVGFAADGRRLGFMAGDRLGAWEVAARQPLTALPQRGLAVDFSPDGRLLAVTGMGVGVWDVAAGRELAHLGRWRYGAAVFDPAGRALCTYGGEGLRLWPWRRRPGAPANPAADAAGSPRRGDSAASAAGFVIELGPPQALDTRAPADHPPASRLGGPLAIFDPAAWPLPGEEGDVLERASFNRGGRLAALEVARSGLVLSPDKPAERAFLRQTWAVTLALSPDGRWAALGSRGEGKVRVWDLTAAKVVKELPNQDGPARTTYAAFSPDGRWLVTGGPREHRVWEVGTWGLSRVLPRDRAETYGSPVAFSPDGRLLAVCRTQELVQLVEPDSGRELVTLTRPEPANVSWLCFSPDGGRLAVASWSRDVAVWDLRAVRRELAARGLDWRPAAPPAPAEPPGGPALAIQVLPAAAPPAVKPDQPGPIRLEAERLPVVGREGCATREQDMAPWNRSLWSDGRQLLVMARRGGYVELEVTCPAAGRYQFAVGLTRADDYGVVQVSLDGKAVDEPFDGFNAAVVPSGKIELGTVELTRGTHRVRFTAVGKNARSKNYYLGIDYLELRPVK
jgi:WD40 repeat protein